MVKVLLVDDEEMNRDFLLRRLQKRGYEVATAGNGIEACEKALADRPELILMDVNMPVMDGLAATQKLKSQAETKDIPVIALTALAMAGDRDKILAAGCDEYETKPIEFAQLLLKMQNLLAARGAS